MIALGVMVGTAVGSLNVLEFSFNAHFLNKSLRCLDFEENIAIYVRGCPHTMCDLISDAGGNIIDKSKFPGYDATMLWKDVSLEEFKNGPLDEVDVIIYTDNFAQIMDECGSMVESILRDTRAFRNGNVYDVFKTVYQASWGLGTDYFEGFVGEPDVALLDMISILFPIDRDRNYFRKAMNPNLETMFVTEPSQCEDVNAPLYNEWTTEPCNDTSPPMIIPGLQSPGAECKNEGPMYGDRNLTECVCNYDPIVDYFPHKVHPDFSKLWDVTYHKHYKVVTEKSSGMVYYLFQCGTPIPSVEQGAVVIQIPVKKVSIDSTTFFSFFDYQSQLGSIVHLYSGKHAADPCVQLLLLNNEIQYVPSTPIDAVDISVLFLTRWSYDAAQSHAENQNRIGTNASLVILDADLEVDLEGRAEWVEFVALFFNREQAAESVTESVKARYDCHVDKVKELLKEKSICPHERSNVDCMHVNSMWAFMAPGDARNRKVSSKCRRRKGCVSCYSSHPDSASICRSYVRDDGTFMDKDLVCQSNENPYLTPVCPPMISCPPPENVLACRSVNSLDGSSTFKKSICKRNCLWHRGVCRALGISNNYRSAKALLKKLPGYFDNCPI